MANSHLVILKKPYLDAILSGQKQIESRFTISKRPPYGKVGVGDKLLLKISSGPVCAMATVAAVKSFQNLTPKQMLEIKQQYNHHIRGSKEYWQSKVNCRFGVLIWLRDIKSIKPVRINKKDWRAWIILTEKEDFGLGQKRQTMIRSKP